MWVFERACVVCFDSIGGALNTERESFETKYLGLPTPEGQMDRGKFQSLQATLAKCLVEWDDNHKSQAAKEVLIKAVAQAVLLYVMSVFKLPLGLCDELTRMIRRYWWGAENGRRKTHWVAWDILLRPKDYGGIGFRDMRLFNQALLARQAWHLLQFPETLCAKVLKAKYYRNGFLLDTVFSGNGSSTWHAIEYGLELLKKGAIWRVGNGAKIKVWRDPWIPRESDHLPRSKQGRCRYRWVSDFISPDGTWNEQRLHQYFEDEDIVEIMKIKPSRRNEEDFVAWFPEKNGMFTVRSAYRLALHKQMRCTERGATSSRPDGFDPCWRLIWKSPIPPKAKLLAWRISRNALATQLNMQRRGMSTTGLCQVCGREDEDTLHVFLRCPHARDLWRAMTEVWDLPDVERIKPNGTNWFMQLLLASSTNQQAMLMMTFWRAWHAHNELTHEKPCPSIEGSRRFLMGYLNSLLIIKQFPQADIFKGKMVIDQDRGFQKAKR
jgi:hypothetical protein